MARTDPYKNFRFLVEIEGMKGFPASCTTPAEAGMQVRTQQGTGHDGLEV